MQRLEPRLRKLEQSTGKASCWLLYTASWSQDRIAAEVARLKQLYGEVHTILTDDEDDTGPVVFTMTHEEYLEYLD